MTLYEKALHAELIHELFRSDGLPDPKRISWLKEALENCPKVELSEMPIVWGEPWTEQNITVKVILGYSPPRFALFLTEGLGWALRDALTGTRRSLEAQTWEEAQQLTEERLKDVLLRG